MAALPRSDALCADSAGALAVDRPTTAATVTAYRRFFGITGGAVAVLRGEELLYRETFGFANVEFQVPVMSDTLFQLSSSTKLFTGTLMMMLEREGVVDYASPVRNYLPELPEAWSDVLLEDVMSHLSGLPEVLDCGESSDSNAALCCARELERPAPRRAGFMYNQTNYLLAKRVIESVTGDSFADVLANRIFEPARMYSAVLNGNSRDVVQKRATGYYPDDGTGIEIREYAFPDFLSSAAGMNVTLDDMIGFARALSGDTLLDAESKARMWSPQALASGEASFYGLGWDLRGLRGEALSAGHEGGSLTTFRVYPPHRLTVIVLTNGMHKRYGVDGFADVIAQSVEPEILEPLDYAAYLARLTYMIDGLDSMSRLIEQQLCRFDLGSQECTEMLVWLAEELTDDGRLDDVEKMLDRFDAEYDLRAAIIPAD
jgi:CubicO group peptidase (beta-lactamase class C family)